MANSKGSSNVRNLTYMGKHSPLPPKSPFPSTTSLYADYAHRSSTPFISGAPNPKDGGISHQRASSESQIIDEQPSWLDELLDEPESPVKKPSHRRSSSDSFAYIDAAANAANLDYIDYNKDLVSIPSSSWGSHPAHFYTEQNSFRNQVNPVIRVPGSSCYPREGDVATPSSSSEQKLSSERKECLAKSSASEVETRRAKQQFAQRSRVRKLQYIAELERNVQALQAGGCEVSAELEFVNQQHLLLSMENKALKQRLENVAQEHLIKYMEHEVLEREIGRLRGCLYQQEEGNSHRRSKSGGNLDSQFSNLSLTPNDPNSGPNNNPSHLNVMGWLC